MAIVKMSDFSLLVLQKDKESVLQQLQCFGEVHFKDVLLNEEGFQKRNNIDTEDLLEKQELIADFLKELDEYEKANIKQKKRKERRQFMIDTISTTRLTFEELEERAQSIDIEEILSIMDESQEVKNSEYTQQFLLEILPWNEKKLKDRILLEIRDAKPIIGTISSENLESFTNELEASGNTYAIAAQAKDNQIIFVIKPAAEQKENIDILCEKFHFKRRSVDSAKMNNEINAIQHRLARMLDKRHRVDDSLKRLSRHKYELMLYAEYLNNLILRKTTESKFLFSDSMVLIEGWIPTNSQNTFRTTIESTCGNLYLLTLKEADKESEDTPVKLANNQFTSVFESITRMYATPKYNEVDPTPIFTPFYLLFFSMMLADVGYGLVMSLVMLAALKIFHFKPDTERMVRFLMYLGLPTILWGIVYGSFFGSLIPMKPLIDANSEYNRVLIMAIVFGIIHLLVGLGVKAYMLIRDRHLAYAIYDVLFWYITLLSAIFLLAKRFIPALSGIHSRYFIFAMAAGMAGIVLTNGRSAKTVPGKAAQGLYSLYGLTNYVSDIVSYSRLMALGLAGGSIGIAINMIVNMLAGVRFIGVLLASGVFIFGHMFNLFISGLSSYVHSSRLIYVEFFSKFYTGGGTEFVPFRAKNTYIDII